MTEHAPIPEDDTGYPPEWLSRRETTERKAAEVPDVLKRIADAKPGATPVEYQPEPDYPQHWTNGSTTR